jgi:hypothetical protein
MKKLLFVFTILFVISCAFTSNKTESDLHRLKDEIIPAFKSVNEYQLAWNKAHANSILWVMQHGQSTSKSELKRFVSEEYPKMKTGLNKMLQDGVFEVSDDIPGLCAKMDKLTLQYKEIMEQLSTFESYESPAIVFATQPMVVDADGECQLLFVEIDAGLQLLKEKTKLQLEKELQQASH